MGRQATRQGMANHRGMADEGQDGEPIFAATGGTGRGGVDQSRDTRTR